MTRTTSVIPRLWGLNLSVGSHNDDEANSRLEGALAAWTADSSAPALAFPACLRCTAATVPVGLARHGAFVNGGSPLGPILSSLLPGVRIVAERFQKYVSPLFLLASVGGLFLL